RRIKLLKLRNVFDACLTRRVSHGCDYFVCTKVDHVRLSRSKVRGHQVVLVRINHQIVKSLSARARQVESGELLECLAVCRIHAAEQKKCTNRGLPRKQFFCITSSQYSHDP